jgi:hypothetical protein
MGRIICPFFQAFHAWLLSLVPLGQGLGFLRFDAHERPPDRCEFGVIFCGLGALSIEQCQEPETLRIME